LASVDVLTMLAVFDAMLLVLVAMLAVLMLIAEASEE
jgi:hypothetical protein